MIWSTRGTLTFANTHIHALYSSLSDTKNDQVFIVPKKHSLKESLMGPFKEVRTIGLEKKKSRTSLGGGFVCMCPLVQNVRHNGLKLDKIFKFKAGFL